MLSEKEYRDLSREEYFNYSLLSEFDERGPQCLIKPKVYSNKGMTFGSLADLLLLTSEEFDNDYHITKYKSTFSATTQVLFDALSDIILNDGLEEKDIQTESKIYVQLCLDIIESENLWSSTKDKEKLKKHFLNEEFKGSLLDKIIAKSKKLVSTEDYMKAQLMAKIIKEHEFTKEYIESKDLSEKQILFQTAILFEYRGSKFKALLDIIVLDHKTKTARVVDYKTGIRKNEEFKYSFFQFRYDIQAALYTKALSEFLTKKGFNDYEILNPVYIYVCRDTPELPLPFMINHKIIKGAFRGFSTYSGTDYKGIDKLVDDIIWHRKHQKYDYPRQVYENKYEVMDGSFIKNSLSISVNISHMDRYHGLNFPEIDEEEETSISEDDDMEIAPETGNYDNFINPDASGTLRNTRGGTRIVADPTSINSNSQFGSRQGWISSEQFGHEVHQVQSMESRNNTIILEEQRRMIEQTLRDRLSELDTESDSENPFLWRG